MIKALLQLSEDEKSSLDGLLDICSSTDSASVTIQIDKTLNVHENMKSWFFSYSGETLIGALSVFGPLDSEAEFTACVHPEYRRKGIFNGLVSAAVKEVRPFGVRRVLFGLDRKSAAGQAVMDKKGYPLVHTEHSMIFPENGNIELIEPRLHIMRTGYAELDDTAQISAAAFEEPLDVSRTILANGLKSREREQYAAYVGNRMVGILSLLVKDRTAMINGLAIKPEEQAKGYGRDFLAQLLRMLARRELRACLDVNSENASAYRLYKRMGFQEADVQDYYELILP